MLPSNNTKDCEGNLSYTSIRLLLILYVNISYPWFRCMPDAKYFTGFFRIPLAPFLRYPVVNGGVWKVKGLWLNFDRQFPMLFYVCSRSTRNKKWSRWVRNISKAFWHNFTCPHGLCICAVQPLINLFKRWFVVFQWYLMIDLPFTVLFSWHAFCEVLFSVFFKRLDIAS